MGLCPLLDTPRNRFRSALKFYEYAASGSVTVASRVSPFADEVSITTANDTVEWW